MNEQILSRLRRKLTESGVDAYLAYTPSSIYYTTGVQSFFISEWWRMLGTVVALVPIDADQPVGMVIGDFERSAAETSQVVGDVRTFRLWVETRTADELARPVGPSGEGTVVRPEQYDTDDQDRLLADMLADRGLLSARIGTDREFLRAESLDRWRRIAPDVEWVDVTDDVYEVRSTKEPFEVNRLERAVRLSELGMTYAVSHLQAGMTAAHVRHLFGAGVTEAALTRPEYRDYSDHWVLPAVGGGVSVGVDTEHSLGVEDGDLIKFDCGTTIGGYRCDGGRTWAWRSVRPESQRLHDVLREAQQAAREMIRPGVPLREVFTAAVDHVRANGYPRYSRGHVGHSVGIDTFHEEPPYISWQTEAVAEEGMVLAVEVPSYTPDVGAIMIEDMVVVHENGVRSLHTLPRSLEVVG